MDSGLTNFFDSPRDPRAITPSICSYPSTQQSTSDTELFQECCVCDQVSLIESHQQVRLFSEENNSGRNHYGSQSLIIELITNLDTHLDKHLI